MLAEKAAAPDSEKRKSLKLAAATTLTTNGISVTTGYLLKLSSVPAKGKDKSGAETSWKRRFFMLRGSTLSYYTDHLSMDTPKGELLVFGQTRFTTDENGPQKNSFSLAFPFNELKLSCESGLDFFVWSKACKAAITLAQQALMGYIDKTTDAEEASKRKYFILHQDALTYHKDDSSIGSVQGIMHLNDHTLMEYFDKKHEIAVIDTVEKHSLTLSFKEHTLDNRDANYEAWKDALIANLQLYAASIQDAETSFNTKIGLPGMIKKGALYMKPLKGVDETWPEYQFYLNESQMVAVDSSIVAGQEHTKMMGDFEITPNCSVFETNLGPHTFELVTASKVLHVRATTSYEVSSWIEAIKVAIGKSYLDTKDELFQKSILKIDNDEFYDITFTEKKPLGVVFERSGEWAIIKTSTNQAESGLRVGSVLSSVNKHSVILESYQDTIDRLKGWTPPLVLSFRRAPRKAGYLLKESKSRSNPQKMVWKKRYFIMQEGRIFYKDSEDANARIKGECPLMGSVVSLLKEGETGKRSCFRLMSGMMYLTLQSSNESLMMEWAATMYHAISIANGGAYILQYEMDRMRAHAEDNADSNYSLKGVRVPSTRIQSSSKSPPNSLRRLVMAAASAKKTEFDNRERIENESKMQEALKVATPDNFGVLVKMICHNKCHGLDVTEAEDRLLYLKGLKYKRSLDPNFKMDDFGEDLVQLELRSLQERNEKRKITDASAQLVKVVLAVGYDDESISALERAIAQATAAGVSAENIEKAKQLLNSLYEGRNLLSETLKTLQNAIRTRSLAQLRDAVATASELGFQNAQLAAEVSAAKKIITSISTDSHDKTLADCIANATIDNHDELANAVESSRDSSVNSVAWVRAQAVLVDLRKKKAARSEVMHLLRKGINERNAIQLQTALQAASLQGLQSLEVDTGLNMLWEIQRENADRELQKACDEATPDDHRHLEELVTLETSGTAMCLKGGSVKTESQSHTIGGRVGADHSMVLMAHDRLTHLKSTHRDQNILLQNLATAVKNNKIDDIDRAIRGADEIGFKHQNVEDARALHANMKKEQIGARRKDMEEISKQEKHDAEVARVIAAIKLEMAREDPLAASLKRALDAAAAIGVNDGATVVAGNKMLQSLNTTKAEEALSRAVESCRYNRDPRSLELAITRAIHDGVSADQIANAKRTLAELDSSHMTRNKALAALDQAVRSRDINSIKRALQTLSDLAGGGVAPGPEADRARKVMLEIYREESTMALKTCLSSPAVMTAEGFDEEKFLRLWKAVEDADRYLPQEDPLLIKGKARLEEQELLKWKCSSAAANLLRAMDAQDIAALESALEESNLLSADNLLAACTLLSNLKQRNGAAILQAAVNSGDKRSATLAAAIEQARRDGVKSHKIAEAEAKLQKLRRDEAVRDEIDAALNPAIGARNLESLELHLQRATANSVTSKTIETARSLVGQLRSQGDHKKIMLLLSDALLLRSVSVLEHVIKSADDAGMDCELLTRAKEYRLKLLRRDSECAGPMDVEKMAHQYLQRNGGEEDYSDDEDDVITDDFSITALPTRGRSVLFKKEHLSVEVEMKGLFNNFCSKIDSTGANCPEFINAMKFSSIWRLITGEKGNLFKEMQMYKRFDVSNRGALSEMDFLDGWALIFQEPGGDVYLKNFQAMAAAGFKK